MKDDLQTDIDALMKQLELVNEDNENLRNNTERQRDQKNKIDVDLNNVNA